MIEIIGAPALDDALSELKNLVGEQEKRGERTLIFCEDRLTLLAEKAALGERGGTFLTEVTTFRRYLSKRSAKKTISKQGSVLVFTSLIAENEDKLTCFKKSSAQAVYETVAQLSASRVDEETLLRSADETEGVLARKLRDLAFLLGKYRDFLAERELLDENGYLALLPEEISKESAPNIFFFAFPSFTGQAREVLRAAMGTAAHVAGIFLSGDKPFYTKEAFGGFKRIAEEFSPPRVRILPSSAEGEAALLRDALFSPALGREKTPLRSVHVLTAEDESREAEEVAARIRKCVAEGKRYRDIAVLTGDPDYDLSVEKAFSAFHIPFHLDRKRAFSEHPFARLVLSALSAAADGMLPEDADDIASNYYFGGSDRYRNYLARYGAYRGGAFREIRADAAAGEDGEELLRGRERVRAIYDLFKGKTKRGKEYAESVKKLFELVNAQEATEALAASLPPEEKDFLSLDPLRDILQETEELAGEKVFAPREFARLFSNACAALSVSLFPRRYDAVFVGDLAESKICRAEVLFVLGLTETVPRVSQDTAVVTDAEIARLSALKVEIEPAIRVVNERVREACALNLLAFRGETYWSYPARRKGKESLKSELFYYLEKNFIPSPPPEVFPYDCCERAPAVLALFRLKGAGRKESVRRASIREALLPGEDPLSLLSRARKEDIPEAGSLWFRRDLSPTLLEGYFDCPYRGFAQFALRLKERERPFGATDAGSFVHEVLERTAEKFNDFTSEEECAAYAAAEADKLLSDPRYSSLAETEESRYRGGRLKGEAVAVVLASLRQLKGSAFRVREAETEIALPALRLRGRADRVDEAGDLVRVIDYKTGSFDDAPSAYYTGRKLQLELYLLSAAEGKRPAGAFYFPASDEVLPSDEIPFRMKGFFCKSEETVLAFDKNGKKSPFYSDGARSGKGMEEQVFADFLDYGVLVAQKAEGEMKGGHIAPSPYEGACEFCAYAGMCGFSGTPRKVRSMNCADIAAIAKKAKEEKE